MRTDLTIEHHETDVLVVGSGAAGMTAALYATDAGATVTLLDKSAIGRGGASVQANIGASAALPENVDRHIADIVRAGRGRADPSVAERLATNALPVFRQWADWGVPFRRTADGQLFRLHLRGQSDPRGLTTGYPMGERVCRALRHQIRKRDHLVAMPFTPAVSLLFDDGHAAGAIALDLHRQVWRVIHANAVVLATGGAQRIYQESTTSDNLTGDAFAMGIEAGADVTDLEFVVFVPSCLVQPRPIGISKTVLEPLRKIAGTFLNSAGEPFMSAVDPVDADGTPWHIGSYGVAQQIRQGLGTARGSVYLRFTDQDRQAIARIYPDVLDHLSAAGIDIFAAPVEVRPMAHFFCGGLRIDADARTSLDGLFAAGEAASGVHGATRIGPDAFASAAVFGAVAGQMAARRRGMTHPHGTRVRAAAERGIDALLDRTLSYAGSDWAAQDELRDIVTEGAGPERSEESLRRARQRLASTFPAGGPSPTVGPSRPGDTTLPRAIETANLVRVAQALVEAATTRRETRGAHMRADFPTEGS